ncbi:MAG: M20/M25/M40 family metallo-hydrolase [Ignavibacteria bacterium]
MAYCLSVLLILVNVSLTVAQPLVFKTDSLMIANFYKQSLEDYQNYNDLYYLCKSIGGRLAGTENSLKAIQWLEKTLKFLPLDTVYLQECSVRHWVRGKKEVCYLETSNGKIELNCCALGTSVGTGPAGIKGKIAIVNSLDEIKTSNYDKYRGKIVFINKEPEQTFFNTYLSYGSAVNQRVWGAVEAAKAGAIGVIIRSVSTAKDYYPHTGIMRYIDTLPILPAIAISTLDADLLYNACMNDSNITVFYSTDCYESEEVPSYNVVAEIKGYEKPDEIILIAAHLDSWDIGEGAHDDGAGIIHGLGTLRLLRNSDYKPKYTIRFVGFIDEEIAQRGAKKYAQITKNKNEKHIVAIESDEGGFLPLGFSCEVTDTQFQILQRWKKLLEPYGLYAFQKGGGGVDISFLKNYGVPQIGLITNSQRYFDYHHSPNDVFENVNRRELQLGVAAITSLIYLIDTYGF